MKSGRYEGDKFNSNDYEFDTGGQIAKIHKAELSSLEVF